MQPATFLSKGRYPAWEKATRLDISVNAPLWTGRLKNAKNTTGCDRDFPDRRSSDATDCNALETKLFCCSVINRSHF